MKLSRQELSKSIILFITRYHLESKEQLNRVMADLDKWIEIAKECKYLPENDLKLLCEIVCDLLVRMIRKLTNVEIHLFLF